MSKIHRLFDLLQVLRRHRRPVAGVELAREAGVSLRTVRRDVAVLQSMGAGIEGEPGFGYVLKPGFFLPPLMFSAEELQALALGAQWVRRQTDDGLARAAEDALVKIADVLPAELRHGLGEEGFHVGPRQEPPPAVDLGVLRRAMQGQRKVRISYRASDGAVTDRVVWPISLGFFEDHRYVAAKCELRQDIRTFRIDRIERADVTADRYPGRRRDLVREWRSRVADEGRDMAGAGPDLPVPNFLPAKA